MQKSRSSSNTCLLLRKSLTESAPSSASVGRALTLCLNRIRIKAEGRFPHLLAAVKKDEPVEEAFAAMLTESAEPFDTETFLYMRHLAGIEGGITLRELDFEGSLPIRSRR